MGFLPFLPSDDSAGIRDPLAEEAVQLINTDLGQLLQLDGARFWDTVLHDGSLNTCIDTYLRFKRRAHDGEGHDGVKGTSLIEQQLARRVFMVLLRIVSSSDTGPGVPASSQKAQWLYKHRVLDVPQLMDVATLYGTTNAVLTNQLIRNVLHLQPLYLDEVHVLVKVVSANLQALQDRATLCVDKAVRGESGQCQALLDAVAYIKDICVSLGSFIGCYAPAALLILQPGQGQLLGVFAALHDRLLPRIIGALNQDAVSKECGVSREDAVRQAQLVAVAVQQLTVQLLSLAYLVQQQPEQVTAAGGSASGSGAAGGSGASGSGSSSWAAAGGSSSSPSRAGGSGGAGGSSSSSSSAWPVGSSSSSQQPTSQGPASQLTAEERGTGLMTAVMCASHVESSGAATDVADAHLLRSMNERFGFDVIVACAMEQGVVVLDETQFDYLLALLESHDPARVQATAKQRLSSAHAGHSQTSSSTTAPSTTITTTTTSAGQAGGSSSGAGPSSSSQPKQPEPAVLASLISQIKDLLGDTYGNGYLSACLHAYSYEVEQVVNALLEGSLKPELQSLDVSLASWSPPAPAPAPPATSSSSWTTAATDAAALRQHEAQVAAIRASKVIASATQPTAGAKAQVHRGVARVLGKIDAEAKAATKVLANELQWEYDDEYDDSYDDLLRTGADGVADVEGDEDSKAGASVQQVLSDLPQAQRHPPPAATAAASAGQRLSSPPSITKTAANGSAGPSTSRPAPRAPLLAAGPSHAPSGAAAAAGGKAHDNRGKPRPNRMWVLDGRIYNYAKEGTTEVSGQQEADRAVKAAIEAKQAIHGLGAGGNKGAANSRWSAIQEAAQGKQAETPSWTGTSDAQVDDDGQTGEGTSAPRQRVGSGAGRGQQNYARKEQNKAAVGNHHRKDRAFRKMGL